MLITKFHRLIRNKVLWGIFAFVLVLAFVAVGPLTRASMNKNRQSREIGKVGDRGITNEEFSMAQRFLIGLQGRMPESDEEAAEVRKMTWQRLGLMQTAERMGITATDSEVSQTILSDPSFAIDGVFNETRYQNVIMSALRVPVSQYEAYVRDRLTLRKMMDLVSSAVWVPPMEIADQVAGMTDQLTVSYTFVTNAFTLAEMDVSEEAIKSYFEEHQEMFRVPDQLRVQYVALSVSNDLAEIEIPEDDIREYYDSNADQYTRSTTNDLPEAIPFEEVRASILAELRWVDARFKTGTRAQVLIDAVLGTRNEKGRTLADVAEAKGLELHTTKLFSAHDRLEEIEPDAGAAFSDAAFDLDASSSGGRISDAVTGKAWVYVLAPVTNIASYIPEFEDVREEVEPLAIADARREAFEARSQSVATAIREAMEGGMSFTNAVQAQTLSVVTSLTFSAQSASQEEIEFSYAIVPSCIELMAGEVSEAISVPGGALVLYVAEREPGDPMTGELMKATIRQQLERYRAGELFMDWQRYNLSQIGYSDKFAEGPPSMSDES